jgi:hypothetical protein
VLAVSSAAAPYRASGLVLWRKAGIRCKQSRTRHEWHDGEKFISPLDQKKKAGGHYAADPVSQLPVRGPVPLLCFRLAGSI